MMPDEVPDGAWYNTLSNATTCTLACSPGQGGIPMAIKLKEPEVIYPDSDGKAMADNTL
jgi:hypothetical protein